MKQIVTTMITPYAPDGSVDLGTAARYVEWYAEGGCTGIFSLCQSSEIFFLSLEERIALQRTVWQKAQEIERRDGKRPDIIASGHVLSDIDAAAEELGMRYIINSPWLFWPQQPPRWALMHGLYSSPGAELVYRDGDITIFAVKEFFTRAELDKMRAESPEPVE